MGCCWSQMVLRLNHKIQTKLIHMVQHLAKKHLGGGVGWGGVIYSMIDDKGCIKMV